MSSDDSSRFSIVPAAPCNPAVAPELAARFARAQRAKVAAVTSLHQQIERLRTQLATTRPGHRVLVVDDNEAIAHQLARVIREETGADVTVSTDADEAMAIVQGASHGAFAAAVVDLHLNHPTINGRDLADALKRSAAVYLVTGMMREELAETGRRVSAEAWYEKPLSAADLQSLCEAIRRRLVAVSPAGATH